MVEVAPHHRDGDQRGHHGEEEDGPEDGANAREPRVHERARRASDTRDRDAGPPTSTK